MRKYIQMYKQEGLKGFIKKAGWPVALGLFMFFLIKGLVYIAIFYGGIEWVRSLLS
jgi:hypothetical protein